MKWLLALLVIFVYLIHQDYWNWHDKTLVFGFLPIGLAYHALYSVIAAIMMWILVKFAWPQQIEDSVGDVEAVPQEDAHA